MAGPLFMAMHGEDIASNRTVPGRFRIAAACFTALEVGGPAVAAGSTRLLARAVPRNSTTQVMAMRAGLAIGRARYALNTPAAARLQAFAATTGRSGAALSRSLTLSRTCASDMIVAARGGQRTVIGKVKDLDNLGPGENSLLKHLPNKGNPKANWNQNSGVLRREMGKGRPLRDASVNPQTGELIDYPGSFLNAERNLLRSHGWTYDPTTRLWSPPR